MQNLEEENYQLTLISGKQAASSSSADVKNSAQWDFYSKLRLPCTNGSLKIALVDVPTPGELLL